MPLAIVACFHKIITSCLKKKVFTLIYLSPCFLTRNDQYIPPVEGSMETANTLKAFQKVYCLTSQLQCKDERRGGVTSQQMGWCNVSGAGDLHEYELQIAQITWRPKAVRNLECQSHLADIWRDIITLRTWKWAGLNAWAEDHRTNDGIALAIIVTSGHGQGSQEWHTLMQ